MSGKVLLRDHLGPSVAKALAKVMLQVPVISDPLIDFLERRLKDHAKAKRAEKQIDRLVERCLASVRPEFERARDVNAEAVALALGETVERHLDVGLLVAKDLDEKRVHDAALQARPLDDLRDKAYGESNVQLYHQALPELIDRLIEAASELKGFQLALGQELLSRQRMLSDDIRDLKAGVTMLSYRMRDWGRDWQTYAESYCGFVDKTLNVIELFGLTTDDGVKEQRLSTAFIPLALTQGDDAGGSGYVETILNRLSKERPRLLITGSAGSGKTTLMRWAALEAAGCLIERQRLNEAFDRRKSAVPGADETFAGMPSGKWAPDLRSIGEAWQTRFPFLIPLRECEGGRLPALDAFTAIGTRYKNPPPEGWVQAVIEAGRALILIDGIDEVATADRAEIRRELTTLCQSFEGNYLVFTTRPGVVEDDWFSDLEMMRAEVSPLSDRDRTALIEHWHQAAAEKIGRDDAERTAADLLEKLRRSPEIAQLGTSPLLAASICALHYACEGYLPRKQADLCRRLCELLIHQRDLQRGVAAVQEESDFGLLDYDHKELLVQAMALAALRGGEPTLSQEDADGLIEDMLPSFSLEKALEPAAVRKHLIERAGVLREAFGGDVDFAHNTLRDFLAGLAFCNERNGHKELVRNVNDQAWHRPIIFAAGAGSKDFSERLIGALIARGSRIARILAVLGSATVTALDPALRQKVTALLDDVLPPKTTEEASLLAALGDAIVDRRLQRKRPKKTAHACARTLRLIGTERAREALGVYWDTEDQDIAEELAQLFNPIAIHSWQRWVQTGSELPESVAAAVSNLEPLKELTELQFLTLNDTQISDLEILRRLKGLRLLSINGTRVADLEPIRSTTKLEVLLLRDTQVTNLEPIRNNTGLYVLRFDKTQVADLEPLQRMTGMKTLWLSNTEVSDLEPLRGMTQLQQLTLNGTQIADLGPLGRMTKLRNLWLSETRVADLEPLRDMIGLQTLLLSSTNVTELEPLRGMTGLQKLWLSDTKVTDLEPLREMTGLQTLVLGRTHVEDVSVLGHIDGLEIIRSPNELTDEQVHEFT